MKHVLMLGTAGAVLVCAIGALDSRLSDAAAANASDPPPPAPEVCYDDIGNTHFVRAGQACGPGEKRTKLIPQLLDPDAEDPQAKLQKQVDQLSNKIAQLEADQEKTASRDKDKDKDSDKDQANDEDQGKGKSNDKGTSKGRVSRVSAPFEVVAPDGTVILRVAAQVSSTDGQGAKVTIGGGKSGNYALRVFSGGNEFVAGVGQAVDGGGLVVVSDSQGPVATMNATNRAVSVFKGDKAAASIVAGDRGGEVSVYNGPIAVVHMGMSSAGDGGNITTALNSGFGVFSAGAAQDGGGEACVNRVTQAGTRRPACVGLGLPSAGMGK